jgi:hypothetical protein
MFSLRLFVYLLRDTEHVEHTMRELMLVLVAHWKLQHRTFYFAEIICTKNKA